jgi:hypothetical protein
MRFTATPGNAAAFKKIQIGIPLGTAQTSAINFAYYATRARGRMAHAVESARLPAAQKAFFLARRFCVLGRFQANVHGSLT